jgi:hypothetical protein
VGRKREKTFRILTGGRWGRRDDCGVPASKSGGGGAWSSVSQQLRHGRVKLRWGVSTVSHGEGLGTFYRAGVVGGKSSKEVARRSVAVRVIGGQ